VWWLTELGEFDRTNKTIDATRVKTRRGTGPGLLLTGVGGGHTLDLRQHALDGAVLLGHLVAIDGPTMTFAPDVERVLAQGDLMFERFVATVDHHVRRLGLEVPEEEIVTQAPGYAPIDSLGTLDLRRTGIAAVVWATGLSRDYPWLHVPVLDGERRPVHTRGVTAFPGLFFLGLTWQSRLLSPFINGVGADAEYLADRIMERLAGRILVERAGARA